MSAAGALVGLLGGIGLLALTSWWRDRRPLPLVDRIAPFVDARQPANGRRTTGWTTADLLERFRPRRALGGRGDDRLRRVRWAAGCAAGGVVITLASGGRSSAPTVLLLSAAGACAGWWTSERLDVARRRRRQRRMLGQLPTVADLVSLAVSAGASPIAALAASADAHPGPLSDEIRRASVDSRSGSSPDEALAAMVERVGLPEVRRFVEALLLATELGTPVGEVARAQAADIRSAARRRWTEGAARREVAMLVPIVFLVLPSVVVVAMFPGIQSLRLVVP